MDTVRAREQVKVFTNGGRPRWAPKLCGAADLPSDGEGRKVAAEMMKFE